MKRACMVLAIIMALTMFVMVSPVLAQVSAGLPDGDIPTVARPVYDLANNLMKQRRYDEAIALYQKLLSWMPADGHQNDLTAWRADIEQRLADLGHPVAPASEEIAPRMQKEASGESGLKPLVSPGQINERLFAPFLTAMDQKIKAHWAPPDFYNEVPVTVLITLNHEGQLVDYRLKESSGFEPADEAALKAVQDAAVFSPLPPQYSSPYVVVTFSFNTTD